MSTTLSTRTALLISLAITMILAWLLHKALDNAMPRGIPYVVLSYLTLLPFLVCAFLRWRALSWSPARLLALLIPYAGVVLLAIFFTLPASNKRNDAVPSERQ